MGEQPLPLVRLQDDPTGASIVSYNVPEPTTYFGNMYFGIDLATRRPPLDPAHVANTAMLSSDPRAHFRDFATLPFKGRHEAIALLRSEVHEGRTALFVKRLLEYGIEAAPETPADAEGLRLVAQFVCLPAGFPGLIKVASDIREELFKLGPAGGPPVDPDPHTVLPMMATNATAQPHAAEDRRSLIFRRFQRLFSIDNWNAIEAKLRDGHFLVVSRRLSDQYDYAFIPIPAVIQPRVFVVEKYRLSSFLGNYGAGRTVKTFSLLPGERLRITVKTFKKSSIESRAATSILDSYSEEAANDFEETLGRERSRRSESEEQSAWHAEAEAHGSFLGFGGSGGGGASGESTAQRENLAKTISESVTAHSQRASAQRDISVDTSYESRMESGEETSIVREIENINVSRTLNFVFRQMNQEYLSVLHLVDAKLGYTSGIPGSLRLDDLTNMDDFLGSIVNDSAAILRGKEAIVDHLAMIVDYRGRKVSFLERERFDILHPLDRTRRLVADYVRVRKDLTTTFEDASSGLKKQVPGIVVSAQSNVLRTEGVLVEALLGQGDGLDEYSHGLQRETVRERRVANDLVAKQVDRLKLGNAIVANNDADKATLLERLAPKCGCGMSYCCCRRMSDVESRDTN